MASWNSHNWDISITKMEYIVVRFASFFSAVNDSQAMHSSGFRRFNSHAGGFIVSLLASFTEGTDKVGLVNVLILYFGNSVRFLRLLRRSV